MTPANSISLTRRLLNGAGIAADIVAAAIFATIFLAIIAQTMMRYVFNSPLSNSQELATLAFIWLIFWVAACNLTINDHIKFDIIYNLVSKNIRRIFLIICNTMFLFVFVYAIPDTWEYFEFLKNQRTASLGISFQLAFFPYFVFFFAFPIKLAINLALLFTGGWQERI